MRLSVERLQQINIWDVDFPQPPPQPLVVRAVEGRVEINIGHIERGTASGPFLYRPVKALDLTLRASQPTEALLRGIKQPVLLAQPVQPVCQDA